MGLPDEEPVAYARGSVLANAARLRGKKLLLVHGLRDENVHARHTVRLMAELEEQSVDYDALVLPRSRHRPSPPAAGAAVLRRTEQFFVQHLLSEAFAF